MDNNTQKQIPQGPTKLCKQCKSIISKEAKICPFCKKKQGGGIAKWIVLVLVICVIGAALGGDDNDSASSGDVASDVNTPIASSEIQSTEIATEEESEEESEQETEVPVTEVQEPVLSAEEFKATCQEFNYKTIARNPDEYIGQNFVVDVKVSQTINGKWYTDYDVYYKVYTNDEYDMWFGDFLYIIDCQDTEADTYLKVLDDDVIRVYATFNGMTQSQNALTGATNDEVSLDMYYCELISE